MESAATGCLFAGHDLGPLRETMAGFGVFTPYTDTRSRLSRDFATTVIEAVSASRADPQTYKRRRLKQIQWFRATHTWDVRAQAWESWLTGLLARPRPLRDQD